MAATIEYWILEPEEYEYLSNYQSNDENCVIKSFIEGFEPTTIKGVSYYIKPKYEIDFSADEEHYYEVVASCLNYATYHLSTHTWDLV